MTQDQRSLAVTAAAYDAIAVRYAAFVQGELDALPLDRAVLAAFAEHVRTAGGGLVADLGCGEGRIGAHLAGLGLDVLGIDLPAYLAEFARVLRPGGHLLTAFFEAVGEQVTRYEHTVTPAYRWPADDLSALATKAGFTEIGRMSREPRDGERFRRGHLLMRAAAR